MNEKNNLIRLLGAMSGDKNKITIHRIYIAVTGGDMVSAAMLDQLVFWSGKGQDKLWTYKSYPDWYNELGISTSSARTARGKLEKLNLIRTKIKKEPDSRIHKLHFQVNFDELLRQMESHWGILKPPVKFDRTSCRNQHDSLSNLTEGLSKSTGLLYTEENTESNNTDKTTASQHNAISKALNLLGFPQDDKKTFVCLLSLHNKYSDPKLWDSNIEYTVNQNPDNPIAYLTQSLRLDYGRVLRETQQEKKSKITLPTPGAEILYYGQYLLIEEDHIVRDKKGNIVLTSGSLYQGLATGTVTVKI